MFVQEQHRLCLYLAAPQQGPPPLPEADFGVRKQQSTSKDGRRAERWCTYLSVAARAEPALILLQFGSIDWRNHTFLMICTIAVAVTQHNVITLHKDEQLVEMDKWLTRVPLLDCRSLLPLCNPGLFCTCTHIRARRRIHWELEWLIHDGLQAWSWNAVKTFLSVKHTRVLCNRFCPSFSKVPFCSQRH